MWLLVAICLALNDISLACPAPLSESTAVLRKEKINYRLPQNVKPLRYHITLEPILEPNLNPAPFFGSVNIELKATDSTKNITLHTRQLNISSNSIFIVRKDGLKVKVSGTSRDNTREFYIIHLESPLEVNQVYNLTIENYVGTLNLDNGGFYLAKYYDKDGRERRMATTQFESINARRAFPSFDEPHLKAKFVVNLIRKENFSSISNEDLAYTTYLGNGRYQDTYRETVPMSTYLAAFVVSEYKHTTRKEGHRVFADEEAINDGQADYALKVGIDMLKSLSEFLETNYSLSKMDQIAIPDAYFSPGAMENWGLVTYKKSSIVYPNKTATTSNYVSTVEIIGHEFAHMWFGNLVTCSWWKYIWLNEGFANYFQAFGGSLIRPRWNLMDTFVIASVQSALQSDSLNSTKPMNYEQDYPGGGPPSSIAYQKSGSVIRMMEHFLTGKVFKSGLKLYLQKNAFRAVEPPDLYEAMQEALDKSNAGFLLGNLTVSSILQTWDSQSGYPLVTVTRNFATGNIGLRQQRFFLKERLSNDNNTWYVPINFHTIIGNANATTADFWLTEKVQNVRYTVPNDSWLIINKQQTGFYRVNYDLSNWKLIINFLSNGDINRIHLLNRAQLLDDSFNLARAGYLHYNVPLDLSKYLSRETEYVPLASFFNAMRFLQSILAATTEFDVFQAYIANSLAGAYKHLGFDEKANDRHVDKLNRVSVLTWLCNAGNVDCRRNALEKLRLWRVNNTNLIVPNLESSILCGALRIGNQDDWDFVYQKYEIAGNTTQRQRILNALGCSEDEAILHRFLDKIVDKSSTLQTRDRFSAIRAIYGAGNKGLNITFNYVDKNFDKFNLTLQATAIINEIAAKFTTEGQLEKLKTFSENHGLQNNAFDATVTSIQENINWSKKYIDDIKLWLVKYSTIIS